LTSFEPQALKRMCGRQTFNTALKCCCTASFYSTLTGIKINTEQLDAGAA